MNEPEDLTATEVQRAGSRCELAPTAHDGELQLGDRALLVVATEQADARLPIHSE